MNSWWCVDIENSDGKHSKTKDHLTLEEAVSWLKGYGECEKDYFLICAVEVFYKREKGYESIVKTEMLRTLVI